jgi:hypothetical protein
MSDDTQDDDDEDITDGADIESAYNVVVMRESFARMEDMMETHNATVERILNKLVSQKPTQDLKKNRQPFSVKVVRDSKGFISELLVEPK